MSEFESAGVAGMAQAAPREIPGEIQELGVMVDKLGKVVEEMSQVLNSAIRKNPPPDLNASARDSMKEPAMLCDIAQEIRNARGKLERSTLRLEDLMNQVEL